MKIYKDAFEKSFLSKITTQTLSLCDIISQLKKGDFNVLHAQPFINTDQDYFI